jgi:hypothetical protein
MLKTGTMLTIMTFLICISFISSTSFYGGIPIFRENNWITPIQYSKTLRSNFLASSKNIISKTAADKWRYEGVYVLIASYATAFILGFLIIYSLNASGVIYKGLIPLILLPAWVFFGIILPLSIPICMKSGGGSTGRQFRFDRTPLMKKDGEGNLNCVRPGDTNVFLTGLLPIRDLNWIGWYNIVYKIALLLAFGYYIYYNTKRNENFVKNVFAAFFIFYFLINFVFIGMGQMFISEILWGQSGEGSRNGTVHGSNIGYFNYLYNKLKRGSYSGDKRRLISKIGDVTYVVRIIFTAIVYLVLAILFSKLMPGFIYRNIDYSESRFGGFMKIITILLFFLPIIIFTEMFIMPECLADKINDSDPSSAGGGVDFTSYTNIYPSFKGPNPILGFFEYIAHNFGTAGGIIAPFVITLLIFFIYFY